jgi:hypothetical protein
MINIGSLVGAGQGFFVFCFFVASFCHLAPKKKGLMNSTKGFLRTKKKIRHISKKKQKKS